MNAAAADAAEEVPTGYTKDLETGEIRPKKSPGRPRKGTPPVDVLKAEREAAEERAADRAPGKSPKVKDALPGQKEPTPPFREGQISRGINRLYRKTGRLVKVMDPQVGAAIIESTRKDDDSDVTVGEAWEEIARSNPRVRRFLLKMLSGGAWGQLFMAHAPILLAVIMKDAIRQRIPFGRLLEAFVSTDEEGVSPAEGTPAEGLQVADLAQMAQMFAAQMDRSQANVPRAAQEASGLRATGGDPRAASR